MNVLKAHLRSTIATLSARGASQREIERRTGIDRKTIRRYAKPIAESNSPGVATGLGDGILQSPPPWPPALTASSSGPPAISISACEPHRDWIEAQVQLGRNAMSIYQELVDAHGFTHRYNSVKRFVAALRSRAPERFDVLEFLPGEEAQVDYGLGAPTRYKLGQYKRPMLFVMTLKYSGKSFRTTVWKTDQETWARLHEQAFHAFGGCPQYVVLDNLKEGVLRPDLYEPELNPVYAAMLAHYGVVADPCRVRDPNRKGTVESAIQHTQHTALKGKRFDTIEAQNVWLVQWEERWAAPRIHGRKKRQVLELFREEHPHLRPLPAERFRCFTQASRTVDDSGLIQVAGSYYAALPAAPHSIVTIRLYANDLEILDRTGAVLRRHEKSRRKGSFQLDAGDRLFNPSRETARLLRKAEQIGPRTALMAHALFQRLGRPGQRALYGLTALTRTYPRADVEAVCDRLVGVDCYSYATVKRALHQLTEARAVTTAATDTATLSQSGDAIRPIAEYQTFWDTHTLSLFPDEHHAHVQR